MTKTCSTCNMTEDKPATYTIHNSALQNVKDLAILLERIVQDFERNTGHEIKEIELKRGFEIVYGEFVNTVIHPLEKVKIVLDD